MASRRTLERRWMAAGTATLTALTFAALGSPQASAVNADHGQRVVSTNPANFTPHVMDGSVDTIVKMGDTIYAGGTFTTVRQTLTGPDITRNRIFAFNATTGVIDSTFNPNLDGPVRSMDTDGKSLFIGGAFDTVDGVNARKVAKLTATGALAARQPKSPNSAVNEVVVRGKRLYLGGGFSNVGGVSNPRLGLAAENKKTGALLPKVNLPFSGTFNGGTTNIKRMDLSPDGSTLVAIGNFLTVDGLPREQIVKIDIPATGAATVSSWSTDRFDRAHNSCAGVFDTWMRDIDFAPDGTYFAVTTTGAFAGGADSGTLCDTTTRWETSRSGDGQQPTWVDYTGGDTSYGVAVTGAAIYTGGHMRWQNNPFQGDQAGPGAVPREGISALDPINGLPLSWNPGRTRGVGAQALYATAKGLWVGSDTSQIGQPRETHSRVAFMPLAGGTTVPSVANATLPNDIFAAQRSGAGTTNVLYRVNASGPPVQSSDGGPDWSADNAFVTGGDVADWGSSVPFDSTVAGGTPPAIFRTERYGSQHWDFPVPQDTSVSVRLFFANQYDGTADEGQRVFDVNIDGGPVELSQFDIVAAAGATKLATMESIPITSDGNIDIDFTNIVENPLINGIEIIDTSAPTPPADPSALLRRPLDGSGSPTADATVANTAIDWSLLRGAFLVNGTLYYGLGDGRLYSRTFNAGTGAVGAQQSVNLYNDPDDGGTIPFDISNVTGMFYDTSLHRLYYTVFNDSALYYRYFTPESRVVGAQTFVADNASVDLSTVSGMTLAGGNVLFGSSVDGALRSVSFGNGGITGSPTIVSDDGTWRTRALFVPNS
ncbi:MAG: malectin domain-containing carbohydrate-binding protein [Candidatus Nanopelagicales bacterium]